MNEGFEVVDFLENIGLSRYRDELSEFPLEDLLDFTDDDLDKLNVLSPHRKKLLAALDHQREASNTDSDPSDISLQIDSLPRMVALPLQEYVQE